MITFWCSNFNGLYAPYYVCVIVGMPVCMMVASDWGSECVCVRACVCAYIVVIE